jgi:hypothetical protein
MIAALLALALAGQATPTAEQPAEPDDIVVLARKLTRVRWDYAVRPGGALKKCRIRQSSGDPTVDALVCEATRQCGAEFKGVAGSVTACLQPRAIALVRELRERRAATMQSAAR